MKPFFKCKIASDVKEEWMMKEYGSWEDHDKPESGHIYPLLRSMPDDQIICNNKDESILVLNSAGHQRYWDRDNDALERRLKAKGSYLHNKIKTLL